MSAPATRLEHDQFFSGSGYLSQDEFCRPGAITTGISLLICLVVGTPRLIAVVHLPIDR